jgi:hypothetical protein
VGLEKFVIRSSEQFRNRVAERALTVFRVFTDQRSKASGRERTDELERLILLLALCRS